MNQSEKTPFYWRIIIQDEDWDRCVVEGKPWDQRAKPGIVSFYRDWYSGLSVVIGVVASSRVGAMALAREVYERYLPDDL